VNVTVMLATLTPLPEVASRKTSPAVCGVVKVRLPEPVPWPVPAFVPVDPCRNSDFLPMARSSIY